MIYYGCDIPEDLYYHAEYDCWVRFDGPDTATMGMTDLAQTLAGKLLFVRFKEPGRVIKAGRIAASIESGKWIGPFKLPFDAELLETNEAGFGQDSAIANRDPYGAGWLVRVRLLDPTAARAALLSGEAATVFMQEKIERQNIRCFRCAD